MVFIPFLLYKNRDNLNEKAFQHKYVALVEGLRTRYQGAWLLYSLFIARRLLFCATIFVLQDFPVLQVGAFVIQSVANLCYVLKVKPFLEKFDYYTEIFNEFCILVISYTLIAFTPINDSAVIKYNCGWLFIAVFVLNVCVNIGLILYSNAVILIMHFKKLILRIKSRLRKNKLQQR